MIESKINKPSEELIYPVLMESEEDGTVVLFFSSTKGVRVYSDRSGEPAGYFSDCWISADKKNAWRKFKGEIILRNK